MKTKCIFIVFGDEVDVNFSNVKSIDTKVVPNIGEEINIKKGLFEVRRKVISYKNVEEHDLSSPERGGELIYIFV